MQDGRYQGIERFGKRALEVLKAATGIMQRGRAELLHGIKDVGPFIRP
jgi:hypothetical protein